MNFNELFKLRGEIDKPTRLVLEILGIILLVVAWWAISILVSKHNVTQIDDYELREQNIEITDSLYYLNDSLMVAHLDELTKKDDATLNAFGLKKLTVSILPSPLQVVKSVPEMFKKDDLINNIFISIKLNFLGYILAISISLLVGFTIGLVPLFRGLFNRIIDAGRFIPLTAVTGIFILWLGIGSEMKITFLAFGILVYLIPVVVQRIDEVEKVYLSTIFTLGATPWQTIRYVFIPYVMSKLIDDIRVLTAISWTYITIAEMLNKSGGIGELIWEAKRQSRIDKAFAVLVIIILIGFIQDKIFMYLDKALFQHKSIKTKGK